MQAEGTACANTFWQSAEDDNSWGSKSWRNLGKDQAGPAGRKKGVNLYPEWGSPSATLWNWMHALKTSLWLQYVGEGSLRRGLRYQRAAVALVKTKHDSCLDNESRDRNRDKQTHLGNTEEVKWTRLHSSFD